MENKYTSHSNKSVYHEKCIAFLNISEKIRYVGIINRFGRTVSGKLRQNVKPLLSPAHAGSLLMTIADLGVSVFCITVIEPESMQPEVVFSIVSV